MTSSNDRPPNADHTQKKRILVVDGQKGIPADLKARRGVKTKEVAKTDDEERRSIEDKMQEDSRLKAEKPEQQPLIRLRAIVSTVIGAATLSAGWGMLTRIEIQIKQVVSVTGQLTTRGKIKEMQAPENKVVNAVFVKEGEQVKKGQPLVGFDAIDSYEKLKYLETQRQLLVQQNQFYHLSIEKPVSMAQVEGAILQLKLPRETAFLARNRTALVTANQQFQAQALKNSTQTTENSQESANLSDSIEQVNSQKALASLAVKQLQEKVEQNQAQLEEVQERLSAAQKRLSKIKPLVKVGAIARVEYVEQQQAVLTGKEELEQLRSQQQRLQSTLDRATEQLSKITVVIRNELPKPTVDYQKQIADNKKQIAEIDSQLTRIILENDRQIADLDRQINRVKQASNSYILKAPVTGMVFDLKAASGFGSQSDREKTLLKLAANDRQIVAEVLIPKEDLDFMQEGMKADVQIDSSAFKESIQGQVISLGADALPPDAIHHFSGVPAKIALEQQALVINNQEIALRSGMSAIVTIKLSKKQTLGEVILQKLRSSFGD